MSVPAGLEAYWPLFCRETATLASDALASLEAWERDPEAQGDEESPLLQLKRVLHSLKGMVATMGMVDLATLVHSMEDSVTSASAAALPRDPLRDALEWLIDGAEHEAWPSDTARDHTRRMRRAQATPHASRAAARERRGRDRSREKVQRVDPDLLTSIDASVAAVDRARWADDPRQLRAAVEALLVHGDHLRLIHSRALTDRLRAMMGPLSEKLGKPLKLEVRRGGLMLDRQLAALLGDALGHIVRNAADHGIEPPAIRDAAGKPATGTIAVRLTMRAGRLLVRVRDDGGGVSLAGVRRVIDQPHASLADCLRAIAAPGVTTARTLSDVSGRGVGLDAVVAARVEAGGRVHVGTAPGIGTRIVLELPMTGRRVRVLPVSSVRATVGGAPWLSGYRPCVMASRVSAVERAAAGRGWSLHLRSGGLLQAPQIGALRWAYRTGRVPDAQVLTGGRPLPATALVRDRRSGEMLVLLDADGPVRPTDEQHEGAWTWVAFGGAEPPGAA